jgi:hypothetical protein
MTDEKKVELTAIENRVRLVAEAVLEYELVEEKQIQPLYYYLRDLGFSNDEIWIHSPHIGGNVGADEPDWV